MIIAVLLLGCSGSTGVEGVLLDKHTDAGISGATVTAKGLSLSAQTGADGRFRLLDLPAGQHDIEVSHPLYVAPEAVSLAVAAGQVTPAAPLKADRMALLNVEAIREHEINYQQAFGSFVPAKAAPREPTQLNAEAVPWKPTNGFKKLAWAPARVDGCHCAYSVEATEENFVVTGTCDADGDGVPSVIVATKEGPAKLTTPADVY